jgi:hypothetical protein
MAFRKLHIEYFLLAAVLLLGAALRLGMPSDFAFINDELSTWAKVRYDSVGEVIANIKAVDSHPVGLYVFVYYWTGIFGTSEWAIKLPFLLMSIFSMGLVYQLGRLWFSRATGLLALAAFATLQFPIWWSHIARQYQSGSFLTLLMAYCWTQWLVKQGPEKRYYWGFILAGAAACYNHYFSGLFAAVVGLSGLFWVTRAQLGRYVLAGVLMVGLFLPHVPITLFQLQYADGHLWYGVPDSGFFEQHLRYLFHYSRWCLGGTFLLAFLGIIFYYYNRTKTTPTNAGKLRLTALLWFVTLPAFGYWYSVQFSPILRPSHLLFSFPYLLLLLFSFYNDQLKIGYLALLLFFILGTNTTTLIEKRRHFEVVHTHPYKPYIQHTKDFLATHDRDSVTIILGENPLYLSYYKAHFNSNFEHHSSFKPDIDVPEMRQLLEREQRPYLIVGALPDVQMTYALDAYPYVLKRSFGVNYTYYILSKYNLEGQQIPPRLLFEEQLTWEMPQTTWPHTWEFATAAIEQDSTGAHYYVSDQEWGPKLEASWEELTQLKRTLRNNNHCIVEVALSLQREDSSLVEPPSGSLVLEFLDDRDSTLAWHGVAAATQLKPADTLQTLYLSYRMAHQPIYKYHAPKKLRVFFWNNEKQQTRLHRFAIKIRQDNPILYKDTQPF